MPRIVFRDLAAAAIANDQEACLGLILRLGAYAGHLVCSTALQLCVDNEREAVNCLARCGYTDGFLIEYAFETSDSEALAAIMVHASDDLKVHIEDKFLIALEASDSDVAATIFRASADPDAVLCEFFDVAVMSRKDELSGVPLLMEAVSRSHRYVACLQAGGVLDDAQVVALQRQAWEHCMLHTFGGKEHALLACVAQGKTGLVRHCVQSLFVPINTIVEGRTAMDCAREAFMAGRVDYTFMHFMRGLGAKTHEALMAETAALAASNQPSQVACALATIKAEVAGGYELTLGLVP